MLCEARSYIKRLTMNLLCVIISPLSQKQAYCPENQTVVAGMQRERDKVQCLTSKLASYLRNNSTRRRPNTLRLLFQEAAWETSQGLQAVGATWASSICSWCRGASLAVLVNAGWVFHQRLPELVQVMPVLGDFADTYLNGLMRTASPHSFLPFPTPLFNHPGSL